jgi:hypothetical protein
VTDPTKGPAGLAGTALGRGLPRQAPERTWGGYGSGADCAICGRRIAADQLEYELEFRGAGRGRASFHVHVQCGSEWELERDSLQLRESKE